MRLVNVTELAQYLRVPETWIYDRTRKKGPDLIPHKKFGKYVRFDLESPDLQRWLNECQISDVVGSDTQRRL